MLVPERASRLGPRFLRRSEGCDPAAAGVEKFLGGLGKRMLSKARASWELSPVRLKICIAHSRTYKEEGSEKLAGVLWRSAVRARAKCLSGKCYVDLKTLCSWKGDGQGSNSGLSASPRHPDRAGTSSMLLGQLASRSRGDTFSGFFWSWGCENSTLKPWVLQVAQVL